MSLRKLSYALLAGGLMLAASGAQAANQSVTTSVTSNIRFNSPITVTKNQDINFGWVKAQTAATYVINTAGTVTTSGNGMLLGGTTQSGDLTIAGSANQTIDISVANYSADNGVTPSAATCAYNGGAAAACNLAAQVAPGNSGKNLKVGVSVAVDGSQADGSTAAPTFDVIVTYS